MSDEELENALVYFEGVYRPNLGIDFANDNKAFEVKAACSGTVTKKENDALLGWVVTVTNENGIAYLQEAITKFLVGIGIELSIEASLYKAYEDFMERIKYRVKNNHLSTDIDTAVKVGSRHGKPIVYEIDTKRMTEDNIMSITWQMTYENNRYIKIHI